MLKLVAVLLVALAGAQSDTELDKAAGVEATRVCAEELQTRDMKAIAACGKGFAGGVKFGIWWMADQIEQSAGKPK